MLRFTRKAATIKSADEHVPRPIAFGTRGLARSDRATEYATMQAAIATECKTAARRRAELGRRSTIDQRPVATQRQSDCSRTSCSLELGQLGAGDQSRQAPHASNRPCSRIAGPSERRGELRRIRVVGIDQAGRSHEARTRRSPRPRTPAIVPSFNRHRPPKNQPSTAAGTSPNNVNRNIMSR